MKKTAVEIEWKSVVMTGVPERGLLKSRNLGTVELIWPRNGIAKKSAARELVFRKGKVEFAEEPWAKRVLYREEVEDHCGIAVAITEPVSVQKIRRFLQLTAKAILKEGADVVNGMVVGYGDVAAAPIDALATMVGEKDAPKIIAQGIVDYRELPKEGEEMVVAVPLMRPLTGKQVGMAELVVRG